MATLEKTEQSMRDEIELPIEGLRAEGEPMPKPAPRVKGIPVSA
jgi:predicted RNase H-like HicB family nuclease